MQGIDISGYLQNPFGRALLQASEGQEVDLEFIELREGPPLAEIKQLVSWLPEPLVKRLFFSEFMCNQCRQTESCMTFDENLIHCENCHSSMRCLESAKIAFGSPDTRLRCERDGATFYLCGVYTGNERENYAILVDYEEMKNNSDKVYVLESMPASSLTRTSNAPGRLSYLKKHKLDQYIKAHNEQITRIIGKKLLFCWCNGDHLPAYVHDFYREEEVQVQQPISPPPSLPASPVIQPAVLYQQHPTTEPIMTPKIVSYEWLVYLALGLLILVLFITMVIEAVLIHSTRTNFEAGSLNASGISFLGVGEVESPGQMEDYVNEVPGGVVPKRAVINSEYTAYLGPNLLFDTFKADNLTFRTTEIQDACQAGMSGSVPAAIDINKLSVQQLIGQKLEVGQAFVSRSMASSNETSEVLNIQTCQFGNLTTKKAANFEILNASVIYAPAIILRKSMTTKTLDSSGQLEAEECDVSTSATLSGLLATNELTPTGHFQLNNLEPLNEALSNLQTSVASLIIEGTDVEFIPVVQEGTPIVQEPFALNSPTLNMVSQRKVTIESVQAENLIFKEKATVLDVDAAKVRFLGGFSASSSLHINSLVVNENCDVQKLISGSECVSNNIESSVITGATVRIGPTSFNSSIPVTVGSYLIGKNGYLLPNGSTLGPSDQLLIQGLGNITFTNNLLIESILRSNALIGTSCDAIELLATDLQGNAFTTDEMSITNLKVQEAINVAKLVAAEYNLLKGDGTSESLVRKEGDIYKLMMKYCEIKVITGKIEIRPDQCDTV